MKIISTNFSTKIHYAIKIHDNKVSCTVNSITTGILNKKIKTINGINNSNNSN